jgi:hypothetical protein
LIIGVSGGFFLLKFYFIILFSAGMAGIICFALTIRLAYASLMKKLQARAIKEKKKTVKIDLSCETASSPPPVHRSIGVINAFNTSNDSKSRNRAMTLDTLTREVDFFLYIYSYLFY